MAIQIFVKLQTPTIELKIEAKDTAKTKDSFIVGFKRYEIKEAEEKLKALSELLKAQQEEATTSKDELTKFVKDEIVYLKQVKLDIVEDGKNKELNITDTRTVKPIESLWENAEECLDALLDAFFASAPYRLSLITNLQKALINVDYGESEVKN